jgi:predicted regulator of Ras-like GTPase activity (Roadblock/LC7/MglB family)
MTVEEALEDMKKAFPDLRWIRIVSVDGWSNPDYNYDRGIKRDTALDIEEDHFSSTSAASLSLGERISQMMGLGDLQCTVVAGLNATYFLLPIGDAEHWVLSFAINGHPSIDKVLDYFKERNFLAEIEPLLKYRLP